MAALVLFVALFLSTIPNSETASYGQSFLTLADINCNRKADIVFVYDDSSSVTKNNPHNFDSMKAFMKSVVNSFTVLGQTGAQFSAVSFARKAKSQFYLNTYDLRDDLCNAIDKLRSTKGSATGIGRGLEHVLENSFKASNGGHRAGVREIVVIVTDGRNNIPPPPESQAKLLKNRGVIVVTVGVGSNVDMEQLKRIASHPELAFFVSAYSALPAIRKGVVGAACQVSDRFPQVPICSRMEDVVFLFGDSKSVDSYTNFKCIQSFMVDVVNSYAPIGHLGSQFSAVSYSNEVTNHFYLKQYKERLPLRFALERIVSSNGDGKALGLGLQSVYKNSYLPANGGRPNARKMLILLTDGHDNTSPSAVEQAKSLKDKNVLIIVIGVGSKVNKGELEAIASSPDLVFYAGSFSVLYTIRENVVIAACQESEDVVVSSGGRGDKGPPGDKGTRGERGEKGEKGEIGPTGKEGRPGRDGIPGKDGKPGRDGMPGKNGKPGHDGMPGKNGKPGTDGIPGKDGKPGQDGIPGKNGKSGRDGMSGKDGNPGRDGVPGKDGKPGRDGRPGKDGIPGRDGKPGKDGRPGHDGKDGKNGVVHIVIDNLKDCKSCQNKGYTTSASPVVLKGYSDSEIKKSISKALKNAGIAIEKVAGSISYTGGGQLELKGDNSGYINTTPTLPSTTTGLSKNNSVDALSKLKDYLAGRTSYLPPVPATPSRKSSPSADEDTNVPPMKSDFPGGKTLFPPETPAIPSSSYTPGSGNSITLSTGGKTSVIPTYQNYYGETLGEIPTGGNNVLLGGGLKGYDIPSLLPLQERFANYGYQSPESQSTISNPVSDQSSYVYPTQYTANKPSSGNVPSYNVQK